MSKNKTPIDDLLFKPLRYDYNNANRLLIIYNVQSVFNKSQNVKGNDHVETTLLIDTIDVYKTVEHQASVLERTVVISLKDLKQHLIPIPIADCAEPVLEALDIVCQDIREYTTQIQNLIKVSAVIKNVASGLATEGQLILTDGQSGLAQIVFNSVTGKTAELSQDDIDRIGGIIMDVVMHNLSLDTADDKQIKKLKAEIEFKIIETLPASFTAQDIKINMDPILSEIKKYQGGPDEGEHNV